MKKKTLAFGGHKELCDLSWEDSDYARRLTKRIAWKHAMRTWNVIPLGQPTRSTDRVLGIW